MKTQKQQRAYVLLGFVTVMLLLAAQFLSQQTLRAVSSELSSVKGNLDTMRRNVQSRSNLVLKYKELENSMLSSGRDNYIYPENANALHSVVNNVFASHGIDQTNASSSSNTVPGGILELRLTFTGPYYGVLKTLGGIRESQHLMKISDLSINSDTDTVVKGTVTILSIAKS